MTDGFDELRETGLPDAAAKELAKELRRIERDGGTLPIAWLINCVAGQPRNATVTQVQSEKVWTIVKRIA